MTHERWNDSVAAYLLGALDDDERVGFEAHLAGCPECREEVEFLRVASEALPAASQPVLPPPELKERIMTVVRSEAELLQAAGARADVPAETARPARREERESRWSWLRPQAALALAAVVLAIGVAFGALTRDAGNGPATRTLQAQVDHGSARAHLEVQGREVRLVTDGLPAPGDDRVYQVWIKRPDRDPEPTDALFTTGRDGSATVEVAGHLEGVEAVLVTREPEGGSQTPSEAPFITAPVSS